MRRASSSSATSTPTSHRLPVNSRRHRVAPEQRRRVATAQCSNSSRECIYPPVVEKVTIPKDELDQLRAKCAQLERCLEQLVPDDTHRQALMSQSGAGPMSAASSTTATLDASDDADTDNEGRVLRDSAGVGRFHGATSGATFLDLLKEFITAVFPIADPDLEQRGMTFLSSLGHYQTFDSQPLMIDNTSQSFWPPQKTEMAMMMANLRYLIQDGSGDFISGGIYYWGDLDISLYDPTSECVSYPSAQRLALFYAASAIACQLESPSAQRHSTQHGESFFAEARRLLGNPLDPALCNISGATVLAVMSIYLVEMNRRDTAYIYVTLGMHILTTRGVHRGWIEGEGAEAECCKRVFWTLYVLDRWLSVLMGRPPTLMDEAIKLALPCDTPGLPSAAGLEAHVKLARIAGYIVCHTYRISSSEHYTLGTTERIEKAMRSLASWSNDLPPAMRIVGDQVSNDRACCELHMAAGQLTIIVVRPIFFSAIKEAVAERFASPNWNLEAHPRVTQIRSCCDAARRNLRLGRFVRSSTPSHKLMSHILHYIFNAAVTLLLNQLLVDSLESDRADILFATDCFKTETQGDSNYVRDCAGVLSQLTMVVDQCNLSMNQAQLLLPGRQTSTAFHVPQVQAQSESYHVGFIVRHSEQPLDDTPQGVMPMELINSMAAWRPDDFFQLYNNNPM
ncbi:hypothetical protein JX265_001176 [Neoarthrinium moseri]|uniref:Xylanolytic transcriptional activator regulatory domain-containing protein n=1 Tax=Neoarthrinium moseri TaxID=1658444 RepID=A0A9P9WXA5_9PEZI|nr:uncharacterized protein JN550_007350 [Neoarthrinium moseri]KAI1848846.1 hypothetical protein JX266_005274 [Neoarthrinium moseri]KAI1866803.1 hypothetical protein JN550_007350 [Neoarthrinium moseri]KAI1880936.1 hypothetical protein JX265_001176 [Neoarthrinium moseri]